MTTPTSTSLYHTTKNGTKTHFLQTGSESGRLLVLLHGLGGSTTTFSPLLPHLPTSRYKVLSIDFEGLGQTALTSPDTELSVTRYVSDLDDLITSVQSHGPGKTAEPIVIIGHSLGSIIALQYTAAQPEKVAGLALLGVGRSASHIPAARERMLGLAAKVRSEGIDAAADLATLTNFPEGEETSPEAKEEVRKAVAASDPEGYARTCEAMASPGHKDPDYSKITCPAVFVAGEKDSISPPSRAQELAPLLGGKTVICNVKGGHQPILSDLGGTKEAITRLLVQLEE